MKIMDLEKYFEDNELEIDYDLFEEDEEHRIYIEDVYIFIPSLNIDIYSGYYEAYNEDTEDFEVDFDFYMFFDSNTKEHLYEEQGSSLEVCIYNYCRGLDVDIDTIEEIENLECEIISKQLLNE
jgi:hypothetical protein